MRSTSSLTRIDLSQGEDTGFWQRQLMSIERPKALDENVDPKAIARDDRSSVQPRCVNQLIQIKEGTGPSRILCPISILAID